MPLFIAALASLFVSLPLFRAYKHALIATGQALDSEAEPAAWQQLIHCRRRALQAAGLPAWVGALAVFSGLHAVPLTLLALASLVLFYLYRIPAQLA